jgi:hypothetical protein
MTDRGVEQLFEARATHLLAFSIEPFGIVAIERLIGNHGSLPISLPRQAPRFGKRSVPGEYRIAGANLHATGSNASAKAEGHGLENKTAIVFHRTSGTADHLALADEFLADMKALQRASVSVRRLFPKWNQRRNDLGKNRGNRIARIFVRPAKLRNEFGIESLRVCRDREVTHVDRDIGSCPCGGHWLQRSGDRRFSKSAKAFCLIRCRPPLSSHRRVRRSRPSTRLGPRA